MQLLNMVLHTSAENMHSRKAQSNKKKVYSAGGDMSCGGMEGHFAWGKKNITFCAN